MKTWQTTDAIVAVVGLGEAGALIARDLVHGGAIVRGWDIDFRGDLADIPRATSLAAAIEGADVVLSVNWATAAVTVARDARPFLRPEMIYADLNTGGPQLKAELASIVESSGALFVDVAMMAPVPPLGIRVPMFLAGPAAASLASLFERFGTPVEVVGTRPGEAAARKLCRSVFFKGVSSAVWEALEAGRAAGVEAWLHGDIIASFESWNATTLGRMTDGTAKHAVRRAHEMHAAAALLRELGIPPIMADATAMSLERIAGLTEKTPA